VNWHCIYCGTAIGERAPHCGEAHSAEPDPDAQEQEQQHAAQQAADDELQS
jgi:hypothetical protein